MTTTMINEVIAKYTAEEQKEIDRAIFTMAMIGVGNAPQTKEEFEATCEKIIAAAKEAKAKEIAKAETKAKKEAEKAEANGMTVEEYKEYKKAVANKKRHENEIRKAMAEIERMKAKIAYEERKVAEYEAKIAEMEK